MHKVFFVLTVLLTPAVFGQELDLVAEELKLEQLLLELRSAKNNQEKKEKNTLLKIEMNRVLQSKEAMLYPFSKLSSIGFIDSPDKQLRIVNWNIEQDDFSQAYTAFVIHIDRKKKTHFVTELKENSFGMPTQPTETVTANNWYGALYYRIIPIKKGTKTIYTVLGWDYNTSLSQLKVIDVIYTNGKTIKLGSPIFKSGKKTQRRVFFEYSKKVTMSLKYEKERELIIFDHLSPESPSLKGFKSFYVPDMSYDGYKLQKGKWILQEDIIGINKGTSAKRQYVYVKNEKTGKVERKEIRSKWLNPEDSKAPVNGGSHVAITPDTEANENQKKRNNTLPKVDKRDKRTPSSLTSHKKRKRFRWWWK